MNRPSIADLRSEQQADRSGGSALFADPLGIRSERKLGESRNSPEPTGMKLQKSYKDHDAARDSFVQKQRILEQANRAVVNVEGRQKFSPVDQVLPPGSTLNLALEDDTTGNVFVPALDRSRGDGLNTSQPSRDPVVPGGDPQEPPPGGSFYSSSSAIQYVQRRLDGSSARFRDAEKQPGLFDWTAVTTCCGLRDRSIPQPMDITRPTMPPRPSRKGGISTAGQQQEPFGSAPMGRGGSASYLQARPDGELSGPSGLLGYWDDDDESDAEMKRERMRKQGLPSFSYNTAVNTPATIFQDNSYSSAAASPSKKVEGPVPPSKRGPAAEDAAAGNATTASSPSKKESGKTSKGTSSFNWPAWTLTKKEGVIEVLVVDEEADEAIPRWVDGIAKQRVVDETGKDAYILCEYDWEGEKFEEDFGPASVRRKGERDSVAAVWAKENKKR
ncbi:unnamed protein product [Amoebophrya sp. A25]|nr:unnamed protein product [Amoebophrya sp. A25]|eukprot:GSA25T00019329001.1